MQLSDSRNVKTSGGGRDERDGDRGRVHGGRGGGPGGHRYGWLLRQRVPAGDRGRAGDGRRGGEPVLRYPGRRAGGRFLLRSGREGGGGRGRYGLLRMTGTGPLATVWLAVAPAAKLSSLIGDRR